MLSSVAGACSKSLMSVRKARSSFLPVISISRRRVYLAGALPFVPRPNPFFDDITQIESRANSRYDSRKSAQQRLDFGLALLGSYTWSKSEDDASNFQHA